VGNFYRPAAGKPHTGRFKRHRLAGGRCPGLALRIYNPRGETQLHEQPASAVRYFFLRLLPVEYAVWYQGNFIGKGDRYAEPL
jgi:hypothetical protein